MARTTISIPDDLKKRMDRVKEPINWSAVAAEAFQLKLGEIAHKQTEKTMDTVIERLRASKARRASGLTKDGLEAGAEWAKDTAEYEQLERALVLDMEEYFVGVPVAPYSWADLVAFSLTGVARDDMTPEAAKDFWEAALGNYDDDERLESREFLGGFVDGAAGLFQEVANKL